MKRFVASLLFIPLFTALLQAQTAPLNIPGTHVYITPPAGYKLGTGFKGVQKSKDIYIKVYDPYNVNYVKYAQTFTRKSLENGGSEVQDYKKLSVSGYQAKYALVQNNAGGSTFFFVFGDSNFSVMLIAACPANHDSDMQQIKAALMSVTYSKDIKTDPLAGTFFNINDTNSSYRFAKCKNDYYIYSSNGIVKDEYGGESIISILPFTAQYSVGDETIARAILNSYEQYGITDAKTKKETQVTVGKLNAMEAEVNAKIDNKKAVLYRLTMIDGNKAILVLGIATSDFDKNMDAFRTLAYTLKFK